MTCFAFGALSVLLTCGPGVFAQSTQAPTGESTSRPQTPDAPPTPPDAPNPANDGSGTSPPASSKPKRTLNKLDPHCIDAIFHTCWSAPAGNAEKAVSEDERQAAEDIQVGYYYLQDKNYRAAESRLREAVQLSPKSAAAFVGLAQAQQKLGKRDDARRNYEAYLALEPNGPDSEKVKKALAQLK